MQVSTIHNRGPFQYPVPLTPHSKTSFRITSIPILGHVIRAIIWLFQKIFPCCFKEIKPIIPEPKRSIAPIREPDKIVPVNLEKILNMPKELQEIMVQSLSRDDLDAFDLALSTCKSTNRLHGLIKQVRTKDILRNILADHPTWQKEVDAWKGVSLEDKLWLVRLYELHHLPFIKFSQISDSNPSSRTPELLLVRNEIEEHLSSIQRIIVKNKRTFKCPEAICLLKNLEFLQIEYCGLKIPPDVRWNTNLKRLICSSCLLEKAPDVRWNVKLEILDLSNNRLEKPPNVTRNVALKKLKLFSNNLSDPPDVTKNEKLTQLSLVCNRLQEGPNVCNNFILQVLTLGKNDLKSLPDLSNNVQLEKLFLNNNEITTLPDFKKNPNLKFLCIDNNPIQKLPDLSQNVNLETLESNGCKLTQLPSFVHNTKLTGLYFQNNQITNFPELSSNTAKLTIWLNDNPLSDEAKRRMAGNPNFLH